MIAAEDVAPDKMTDALYLWTSFSRARVLRVRNTWEVGATSACKACKHIWVLCTYGYDCTSGKRQFNLIGHATYTGIIYFSPILTSGLKLKRTTAKFATAHLATKESALDGGRHYMVVAAGMPVMSAECVHLPAATPNGLLNPKPS